MNMQRHKEMKTLSHQPVLFSFMAMISRALCGLIIGTVLTSQAQAAPATLVSLTFDDGASQSAARNILSKHNMHATFYINSDRINQGGIYLTKAELDGLYADGNEIGGHTLGHVDLATLSDSAQQAAICNDMRALSNLGYRIRSLAYPFGSTGPSTQRILAAGCPGLGTYESARTVGGLVSGSSCQGCPWAESLPPANRYFIATNDSIKTSTSLDTMKTYVTQAENHGGGWVPLVFHRVCDGCDSLAVRPAVLDAFLTWLESRTSRGTYVRTVHDVIAGNYPKSPPTSTLGPNLIKNSSLESDANNDKIPDCWGRYGYGDNSATWTRTSDSHSGSVAQSLNVTRYVNGDRKLLTKLDAGQPSGCAPLAQAGDQFQLGVWYKATAPVALVIFYRDSSGAWQYWRDGPQLPAASNWKQLTFNPGGVPAGAKAISFGIAMTATGSLTTDDYSLRKFLQ